MRAVVHSLRFPDVEHGQPVDPSQTAQLVEIYAGPSDGPGEEQFQATVCTPGALAEILKHQEILVGRHWLFMAEFNPHEVERFLRKMIQNIEGATWNEVAAKIGRLGQHEFEGPRCVVGSEPR